MIKPAKRNNIDLIKARYQILLAQQGKIDLPDNLSDSLVAKLADDYSSYTKTKRKSRRLLPHERDGNGRKQSNKYIDPEADKTTGERRICVRRPIYTSTVSKDPEVLVALQKKHPKLKQYKIRQCISYRDYEHLCDYYFLSIDFSDRVCPDCNKRNAILYGKSSIEHAVMMGNFEGSSSHFS